MPIRQIEVTATGAKTLKKILRRYLTLHGYEIKRSSAGWWVDGVGGFMVSDGYHSHELKALLATVEKIGQGNSPNLFPQ